MFRGIPEPVPASSAAAAALKCRSASPVFSAAATIADQFPHTVRRFQIIPAVPQSDIHGRISAGLAQRFQAISLCLDRLLAGQTLPPRLQCLTSGAAGAELCKRLQPLQNGTPGRISWLWFASTDLRIDAAGNITVLDHCCSLPNGLELLQPEVSAAAWVRQQLFPDYAELSQRRQGTVLLDSGCSGRTWSASQFLADCLQVPVVSGRDLFFDRGTLYRNTGIGSAEKHSRVTTVIRRIEDDCLDPDCLRADSLLGVPGLIRGWKTAAVQLLSPPGTGLVDLRHFARLVPQMIRSLLGETPLLESTAALDLTDRAQLHHLLTHASDYLIRTNDPAHPQRPLNGREAHPLDWQETLRKIRRNPLEWTARPLLDESATGLSIRVFSSQSTCQRLLPVALTTQPGPDGGIPLFPVPALTACTQLSDLQLS